ncbi:hypothetical protein SAMN04488077_1226 [Roseovarius tolerans]|uniref:Uncharacterized protein n=1 Tax=Roseovarius tolerans TaxID=74031 RepID=A0A1H8I043_9RHOB|nr:hypothetical protein [Roseovarius tolerans]SEN61707.1 hypothetical protein SAMN04488077_1226 [Roseovarius tolerans]
MNQDLDSFRMVISDDAKRGGDMHTRWLERSQQIIDTMAARNVTVSKEDVALSNSARIYALTGAESGDAIVELTQCLPQVQHQQELREVRDALSREDHPQHDALQAKLDGMSQHQKMAYARTLPPAEAAPQREYNASERAELIRQNARLPYKMKIDHARKHGLL